VNHVAAARLAYGVTLLAAPETVLKSFGSPNDDEAIATARILGARHVLQAVVQRRGALSRVGASVDAFHAISMAWLASVSDRYRRAAIIDGIIAGGFATLMPVSSRRV
jgi:hypothetical protein